MFEMSGFGIVETRVAELIQRIGVLRRHLVAGGLRRAAHWLLVLVILAPSLEAPIQAFASQLPESPIVSETQGVNFAPQAKNDYVSPQFVHPEPRVADAPLQQSAAPAYVYVSTRNQIGRTANFFNGSPVWEDIRGAIPSNQDILDFVLHPGLPSTVAFVSTATTVYRTTNLNGATPTWTAVLTDSAESAETFWRIIFIGDRILVTTDRFSWYTSDDNGTTWTRHTMQLINRPWLFEPKIGRGITLGPDGNLYATGVPDAGGAMFIVSYDKGLHWTFLSILPGECSFSRSIYSPSPGKVYVTNSNDSTTMCFWDSAAPQNPLGKFTIPGINKTSRKGYSVLTAHPNGSMILQTNLPNGSNTLPDGEILYFDGSTTSPFITYPGPTNNIPQTIGGGANAGPVMISRNGSLLAWGTLSWLLVTHHPWATQFIMRSLDGGASWEIATGNWYTVFKDAYNRGAWNGASGSQGEHANVYFRSPLFQAPPVSASAVAGSDACPVVVVTQCSTQETKGNPINTRTGNNTYTEQDLVIPVPAGSLLFERAYSTFNARDVALGALGRSTLSAGWSHNYDARLIFGADPGGEAGRVLLQAPGGSRIAFHDFGNHDYVPEVGFVASLEYDTNLDIYSYRNQKGAGYDFDADGKLIRIVDETGNELLLSYDSQTGQLDRVEEPSGLRYLDFTYEEFVTGEYRLTTVTDHTSRSVQFGYDQFGAGTYDFNLSYVIDSLGNYWYYTYADSTDPNLAYMKHYLAERRQPTDTATATPETLPVIIEYIYDEASLFSDGTGKTFVRAVEERNGEGDRIVFIDYDDPLGIRIEWGEEASGRVEYNVYDQRGTFIGSETPDGESATAYDFNFRPAELTDEAGDSTLLAWSADGANLEQVEDALGNTVDLDYDGLGNLTDVVDSRGYLTTYDYSGTLLTESTDALANTTGYTYTAEGYLESATDARGNTTTYAYNAFGQLVSTTDALNHTTSYAYDSLGRLTDVTDALGRVTHNEYDAAGQLVRVTRNYDPARTQNEDGVWNIVSEFEYDLRGRQIRQIDTFGRETEYVYDDAGRLIQVIDPDGNVSSSTYDANGNLVASTDALGRTTTYTYDELDRLVATTDALNNTTSMAYNPDGTVASTTDALGHTTTYTYDVLKRVIAVTDELDNTTTTDYDEAGNVIATTDARGNTSQYEYDALGRLILQTAADGGETEFFYDENGNRVQVIDARGHATTYAYDELNRLVSITDALGNITTFTYDALGNRISVIDPRGNTTLFVYDALNRLVETVDALENSSATEYDALGRAIASSDPLNRTATYAYDILDRLTSQTDPLDGVTSYTFDDVGNLLTATDPNGHTSITTYDALNRPVTITDPNGNVSTTSYNAVGNVLSVTDALTNETTFTYDDINRQTGITNANGDSVAYTYDANGNRVAMTDANGVVTRFEYDVMNRLSAVVENYLPAVNPDHETNVRTEYTYDLNGNRLTITDGNGHVTSFTYDDLNRMLTETDALGNTWTYGYDAAGNRVSLFDANGALIQYTYDELNRLTGINYPNPDPDVSFVYDAAGQRTTLTDGLGTTTWTYDDLGRPTSIEDPFENIVGYGYDAAGNRTSLTYPDGKAVDYAYDNANRLSAVTDWDEQVTGYAYDNANRLQTVTLPNAVVSAYVYDPAGQLLSLTHTGASETELSSFAYQYDDSGNRVSADETLLLPAGGSAANPAAVALQPADINSEPGSDSLVSYARAALQETVTETPTDIPTATNTAAPPATPTATDTPTSTQPPAATATPTAESSATPMPAPSNTATATLTATVEPNATVLAGTATPTSTTTATPTATATETVTATATVGYAGVLVVNSTADAPDSNPGDESCDDGTGQCTLRAAIQEANALPGSDAIHFNISGDGPHWIALGSALPSITDPITIDGSTQLGYSGTPLIVLDGSQAGDWVDGIALDADGGTLRGLALVNFGRAGIRITSDNNTIEDNFLGIGPTGQDDRGNTVGLLVEGANNVIRDNLVSGNEFGIYLYGANASANILTGNRIGTDITGAFDLGNGVGIRVKDAADNQIDDNLISANDLGIVIQGSGAEGNDVFGNVLGLDGSGTELLGNHQIGIWLFNAPANLIGGSGLGESNQIYGSPDGILDQGAGTLIGDNEIEELTPEMPADPQPTPTPTQEGGSLAASLVSYAPAEALILSDGNAAAYSGQTFVVDSTGDGADANLGDGFCADSGGACSLRAAIQEANQDVGSDRIEFAIAGTGPHVISPATKLPLITGAVVIDGASQPGYTAITPMIVIDGAGAGAAAIGLEISAGSSTVRGLVVVGFDSSAIALKTAGSNVIRGNFLGIDADGETAAANWRGISVTDSNGNLIGGSASGDGNLISGNETLGIFLDNTALDPTADTIIQGNSVGTDISGTSAVPNAQDGIVAQRAAGTIIGGSGAGEGNLVSGNADDGIYLYSTATGTVIQGNTIGTDITGTQDLGNGKYGIGVQGSLDTTIGGSGAGEGNLVSGNGGWGIYLAANTTDTLIQGNTIGADISGTVAIANYQDGINLDAVTNLTIGGTDSGEGNLISGNTSNGINIPSGGGNGIYIQGNTIGLNAAGTSALANGYLGISVNGNHTDLVIGGAQSGAGNVISGNVYAGLQVSSTGALTLQGNLIGTNAAGTAAVANGSYGVMILNSSTSFQILDNVVSGNTQEGIYSAGPGATFSNNMIGTDITGATAIPNGTTGISVRGANTIVLNNLISGNNGYGILVMSGGTNATIQGNIIGLDATGQSALPNTGSGVSINAASGVIIGGGEPGEGNHIAFNGGDGVTVVGSAVATISGNSIHANGSIASTLGIDLMDEGVTANDTGDADTGANDLQNYPVLTAAMSNAASYTTVEGSLNSIASTEYRLEFFASAICDTSGNGEGQAYLGFVLVTTDASGDVTFSETLDAGAPTGMAFITSTATDSQGRTSEFSGCVEATIVPSVAEYSWKYDYDPLNRLIYACSVWNAGTESCDGEEFEYVYDAVGNRLSQTINGLAINYSYDDGNRLTSVAGQSYTWDDNGNLLDDGTSTYTYNHANRLVAVSQNGVNYAFAYNGSGDRLQQSVDGVTTTYTLDLAAGLTQVLADGTNSYLYGLGRVGEEVAEWQYHLGDALGSVRQLAGTAGAVSFAQSYAPYGNVLASDGAGMTAFGFTGEWADATGLVHLRARYFAPSNGVLTTRDQATGNPHFPRSFHKYSYALNNPLIYTDPSGFVACMMEAPLAASSNGCLTTAQSSLPLPIYPNRAAGLSKQEDCDIPVLVRARLKASGMTSLGHPTGGKNSLKDVENMLAQYGVVLTDSHDHLDWDHRLMWNVFNGIYATAKKFSSILGIPPTMAFKAVYGITQEHSMVLQLGNCPDCNGAGGYTYSSKDIRFESFSANKPDNNLRQRNHIVHELGHAFRARLLGLSSNLLNAYQVLERDQGKGLVPDRLDPPRDSKGNIVVTRNTYYGFASPQGVPAWQQNPSASSNEELADMFLGWVFNTWQMDGGVIHPDGKLRSDWMDTKMQHWVPYATGNYVFWPGTSP